MPIQTRHRFTTGDYYRMAETGVLRPDERVELIEGEIIDMSPIGPYHGGLVNRLIRKRKLPVYARAGIAEVWLFNLPERKVEVFRQPRLDGYGFAAVLRRGDQISPLAFPALDLNVAELLA